MLRLLILTALSHGATKEEILQDNSEKEGEKIWSNFEFSDYTISATYTSTTTITSPSQRGKLNIERKIRLRPCKVQIPFL